MKNRIEMRKRGRTNSISSSKTLILTGFAVLIALSLASFAIYTRTAATQELDKGMPTLNGDAARTYLRDKSSLSSLRAAFDSVSSDVVPATDPLSQSKLLASDGTTGDNFSHSLSISGDTAIVGAPQHDMGSIQNVGAAYIFVRNGDVWSFQQKLTGGGAASSFYGFGVAISGNTAISTSRPFPPNQTPGSADVYVRNGTTWTLEQRLVGDNTANDAFGKSVAIEGNTAAVAGGTNQATVGAFVFVRSGTVWTLQQKVRPTAATNPTSFGAAISLSGNTLLVGDPISTTGCVGGCAYVFLRNGTEWTQEQKLSASDATNGRDFGTSVSISGETLIVGLPAGAFINEAGAAYIFDRVPMTSTWTQRQKLTANDAAGGDRFGAGVSILGDMAVVGSRTDDVTFDQQGSAYVFTRTETNWTQLTKLTAFDGGLNDHFGSSIALSGDSVLVGAVFFPNTAVRGAAYVIPRCDFDPSECEAEIEVNITTDQPDIDLEDDVCDVDMGQSGNQCSLRAAIQTANAKDGPDEILFNIPGGGVQTISPLTQLPSITEKVSIDATTQPGYSGTPMVELRGDGVQGGLGFFNPESGDSLVSGLAINRFAAAVAISSSGNRIERCYIGLDANGAAGGGTAVQLIGIDLRTAVASNNTIGGAGALGNVISDNGVGVAISQGAPGNKVLGNKIGTNAAGTAAIPNVVGAFIDASSGNRIGDAVVGTGNLISGSTGVGITINTGSTNNLILGNFLGTNAAGTEALANANGVIIDSGSSNNRVGSDTGLFGNVISGSTFSGVTLKAGSSANVVAGNKIGTNPDGTVAIPNKFGVALDGANGNTIGDLVTSAKGNLISGNTDMGVVLQGNSANNRVSFNSIGTRSNGTEVLSNGEAGVLLTGGVHDNTIEANVVGGHDRENSGSGIALAASVGPANLIMDNYVGVARNGTTALPNWFGIGIAGDGQIIGSRTSPNLIGKNKKAGVVLAPASGNPLVEGNTVEGNLVGTNGTVDVGNDEFGIWLNGPVNDNTISHNHVSGNFFVGIAVTDGSSSNDILDNFIGIDLGGTLPIPNGIGIWVRQATDNTISRNLVAGNDIGMLIGTNIGFGTTAPAVEKFQSESSLSRAGGTFTSGNRVHTNIIGVGPSGPVPNRIGIAVGENARNNFIGMAQGGNLISGNTNPAGWGLLIGTLSQTAPEDTFPQFNTIQSNRIGTTADLLGTVPNTVGLVLVRASRNTIGGDSDALANFIMASTREGILMSDGTGENIFLKNYVGKLPPGLGSRSAGGTPAPPTGAYGNGSHGILIENGAYGNTLGGTTPATGMVISDNGGNGIHIASTAGNGNRIGANSISGNTLPGIDLGGNGFTVNDPADPDVGPNNLQNYPTMTLSITGGNLIVNYQVDSAPANSVYGATGIKVDFYEADSTGQGSTLLGTDQYLASDYANGTPGTRQKNLGNAAALGIVAGDRVTGTATDADGNSSEFTPAVIVPGGAPGFEGDVAPRPNGDGNLLSTDVTQLRRFVAGLDTPNLATNEVQRIDCAPRSTGGDGIINSTDVVQGRRFVAGLDPLTPAGGPARWSFMSENFTDDLSSFFFKREIRIGQAVQIGRNVSVPVEMISNGSETAMSFTIEYDAKTLVNPRVALGDFAPKGSTLTVNTTEPGRIGILIDSNQPMTASAIARRLAVITFDSLSDASVGSSISLTGSLAALGVSDGRANSLATTYQNGAVKISP